MILKGEINGKFQIEEKVKKSEEREWEREEKERETKHKLGKQKIQIWERDKTSWRKKNKNNNGRMTNNGETNCGEDGSRNARINCNQEWDW